MYRNAGYSKPQVEIKEYEIQKETTEENVQCVENAYEDKYPELCHTCIYFFPMMAEGVQKSCGMHHCKHHPRYKAYMWKTYQRTDRFEPGDEDASQGMGLRIGSSDGDAGGLDEAENGMIGELEDMRQFDNYHYPHQYPPYSHYHPYHQRPFYPYHPIYPLAPFLYPFFY